MHGAGWHRKNQEIKVLGFRVAFQVIDGGRRSILFVERLAQPLLQNRKIRRFYFTKRQAHTETRLRVHYGCSGFEEVIARNNFYIYASASRQGTSGVQ